MIRNIFANSYVKGEERGLNKDQESQALEKIVALLSFQDLYIGLAPQETPAVFSLLQVCGYLISLEARLYLYIVS